MPHAAGHDGGADAGKRRGHPLHLADAEAQRVSEHAGIYADVHPAVKENPLGRAPARCSKRKSLRTQTPRRTTNNRGERISLGHARRGSRRRIRIDRRSARRRQKAASVERSAGRLAKFEAASDNELVIGCAVRSVLRAPRSTPLSKILEIPRCRRISSSKPEKFRV